MMMGKPLSLRGVDPELAIAAFLAVKPPKATTGKKKPATAKRRAKKGARAGARKRRA
jgi:hypothetical protein